MLDAWYLALGSGFWILDTGYWINIGQILEDLVPISGLEGDIFVGNIPCWLLDI